jgi:Cu2+-exporting ATPase
MGKTVVVVTTQDEVKGLIALSDTVRAESLEACAELKKDNFELALITGDNETVANNVADQLGITKVFANALPDQKVLIVKSFQDKGYYVAMVGDGINDAPALAQANVGIAIGSGTDIAAETSDVILAGSDPRDVVSIIKLSKLMKKKMLQNLAWATGYNLLAIPFAAGLFHKYGISISPALGAIAMSLSTVIVTINSRLIKITK